MLPSGLLVKTELADLISILPRVLISRGPSGLKVEVVPEVSESDEFPYLDLSHRQDGWCLIETSGPEELRDLVLKCLLQDDPSGEMVSCLFQPEDSEYGYALYRGGKLLESFESRGPSIETINFTSDLRRVELQKLLKVSEFMIESVSRFGIDPDSGTVMESGRIRFRVDLPGKKSILRVILGAAWPK